MKMKHKLIAGALLATFGSLAMAQTLVGVSWSNFQEERWKTDEAAIKGQLLLGCVSCSQQCREPILWFH